MDHFGSVSDLPVSVLPLEKSSVDVSASKITSGASNLRVPSENKQTQCFIYDEKAVQSRKVQTDQFVIRNKG